MSSYVTYTNINTSHYNALIVYSSTTEPQSFAEAAKDPKWVKAMQLEIEALEANHTWSTVDLPPNKMLIGCKWIFKIKYKASGEREGGIRQG